MNRPSSITVEDLLFELASVSKPEGFEIWIPRQLTIRNQKVPSDVAMAIILDKILGMGFQPDGFSEGQGGRVYRYKPL